MKKNYLTESILNELDSEVSRTEDETLKELAESIKNILTQCNADISYVTPRYDGIDNERIVNMSCKFTADKLSKYDNDVSLYGNLYFDENYILIKSNMMTSSGPNVLNHDFIQALNALYSYFKSGNNHYDL